MKKTTAYAIRDVWKKEPVQTSLMTSLSLIGGEILLCLENCGRIPARQVARQLEWPLDLIFMAIGSLINEGAVRVARSGRELVLEPAAPAISS